MCALKAGIGRQCYFGVTRTQRQTNKTANSNDTQTNSSCFVQVGKTQNKMSKENKSAEESVEPEHGRNAKTEIRHTNDHGLRGRALSDDDEMVVVAAVKGACKTIQKLND